ncbi:hypothetical protein LCGC14_2180580 [marine sediment metagenome]|uniref:Uncharacterized protein n=1 Tax=marine sediment metagenome TaxID=412755 RepID=A0A0F9DMJ5_9ZZZZ
MNILILNPPAYQGVKFIREGRCEQRLSSFQFVMVPISLPLIAGLLGANGHEVKIIDTTVEDYSLNRLEKKIKEFDPKLIIVNFSTTTFYGDIETVKFVKGLNNAHLTAIGTHVTSLPQETLEQSLLDSVIRGEPEKIGLDLAEALEAKEALENVKGLSFKNGEKIVHNSARPFIKDLDELPFPARDLLKNDRYIMPISNKPYTLVVSSRGCTHNCIYCTAKQYYGKELRLRSAKNVVDEVEEVVDKFEIKNITMWSDTFTLDRDFVVAVSNEILKRNLNFNWMANSRVDRVDYDLLKLMKESGCSMLSFGVESGVQQILNNVKKGATLEHAEQAFDLCRELGIETIAHFIFGLPDDNMKTMYATRQLVKQLQCDWVNFYCAMAYPGSQLYKDTPKEDLPDKWEDYDQYSPNMKPLPTKHLTSNQVLEYRDMSFKGYFSDKHYLKRIENKFGEQAVNQIQEMLEWSPRN